MKRVLVRGPLLSISGYGTHTRQVFRWLESKPNVQVSAQILPWGRTPWLINPELEDGLVGKIMEASAPSQPPFDASFQVQLPNEWDPSLARYNVGISAFVETDKCNPAWLDACNRMQHVVVPSSFIKTTISNTGSVIPSISVIPESYYDCLSKKTPNTDMDLNLTTDFNLLIFGQITGNNPWSDRKNTFFAIKWLCEEFADDPNVGIILKSNFGSNTTLDRKVTINNMTSLLNEVRKGEYPKFYLLHGRLTPEEMHCVYKNPKIKGMVSATRGEGFGLPFLEAAVSDLPILATDWSGHLDFLNKGKFIKFNYDLKEVHESKIDNHIFIKDTKWAEVREDDFKSKVRKFREKSDKPKQWAVELGENLRNSHSQSAISDIYEEVFGTIL